MELHFTPPTTTNYATSMVAGLNGFMWTMNTGECWRCKDQTHWLDLDFECRLCPGACSEWAWDQYNWANAMAHLNETIEAMVKASRARHARTPRSSRG
jgi:hypothetical protein